MALEAAARFGFDPGRAFVVGDHAGDVGMGRAVGATTFLVLTGHGVEERARAGEASPTTWWPTSRRPRISSRRSSTRRPSDERPPRHRRRRTCARPPRRCARSRPSASTTSPPPPTILIASLRAGGKLLICGNGGSAADAQHLATEFVSTLTVDNPRPSIPAIALTTDTSLLTAIANDFGIEGVFARQVESLGTCRRRADRDLDERQLGEHRAGRRAGAIAGRARGRAHGGVRRRARAARRRGDPRALDRHGAHPGVPPGGGAAPRAAGRARALPRPADTHRAPACRWRASPSGFDAFPDRYEPGPVSEPLADHARARRAARPRSRSASSISRRRGAPPSTTRITEIGAVKYRGGERLGSFQALVNPRRPIPPSIAHLTGIDDRLVSGEPPIEQVLPAFLEFFRGSVFVAHNAGFDFGFLNASCDALDYPPLPGPPSARPGSRGAWSGPTCPNVKLRRSRTTSAPGRQPTHRALDDAEACAEVLHGLLDLGGRLGILTMGDLAEAVRARGRPNFGKIRARRRAAARPGRLPVPRPRRAACSTSARPTTCARA